MSRLPHLLRAARAFARSAARAVPAVVGAPDYDRYVAFLREADPGCPPPDRAQFERERLAARYARPGARCC